MKQAEVKAALLKYLQQNKQATINELVRMAYYGNKKTPPRSKSERTS